MVAHLRQDSEKSRFPYSVLMSVYHREEPRYLKESVASMMDQTDPPGEFVLVCDGPLGRQLDCAIDDLLADYGSVLHVVRLADNVGLGPALNAGLVKCSNEFVARMDSDDVSSPDRCRLQLEAFANDPRLEIVGGWVGEFKNTPKDSDSMRIVPETNEEICDFAKVRSPFNHMTVMFRKSSVLSVGGYRSIPLCEDYDLWARMLISGCRAFNIQKVLVWMRVNRETLARRRQPAVHKARVQIKRDLFKGGFMTRSEYVWSLLLDFAIAHAPLSVMSWATSRLLRDEGRDKGGSNGK